MFNDADICAENPAVEASLELMRALLSLIPPQADSQPPAAQWGDHPLHRLLAKVVPLRLEPFLDGHVDADANPNHESFWTLGGAAIQIDPSKLSKPLTAFLKGASKTTKQPDWLMEYMTGLKTKVEAVKLKTKVEATDQWTTLTVVHSQHRR